MPLIPIIIAVAALLGIGTVAATSNSGPTVTTLEKRYYASRGMHVPTTSNTKAAKPAQVAEVPAPVQVAFSVEGKHYKTASRCLTDAWAHGVRGEVTLRGYCPGE